jgi:glycosyltransferase involved in cell wall biosynthesis
VTITIFSLDSFSFTVLESLSCGTPVIAYNIPAIKVNDPHAKSVLKIKPLSIGEMVKTILDLLENEGWKELSKDAMAGYTYLYR